MNRTNFVITLLIILVIHPLYAQQSIAISGNVFTCDKLPAEGANIVLLNSRDSVFVTGTAVDERGNFRLKDLTTGNYLIEMSMLGFQKEVKSVYLNGKNPIPLDTVYLIPDAMKLGSVEVVGKRPLIEIQADKTVINLDASIINTGKNAFIVLETLPGVFINNKGNVSLNGKNGTKVMLDSRTSYLEGEELVSYLKSIPSSSIEKIELITNPSSKFDASGNSGIINIRTKRNRTVGFDLGINTNFEQGKYGKTNNNLSFNHRNGKFNLFGMYGYYTGHNYVDLQVFRKLNKTNPVYNSTYNQDSYRKRNDRSHYYKAGIQYFASTQTSFELSANGYKNNRTENGSMSSSFNNYIGIRDSSISSSTDNENRRNNFNASMGMLHKIDSAGKELSSSFDYLHHSVNNDQFHNDIFAYEKNPGSKSESKGLKKGTIILYSGRVDLTYPVSEKLVFDAGLKSILVKIDDISDYKNKTIEGWQPDYGLSTRFLYKENINAMYASSLISINSIVLEAGIRLENTHIKGNLPGNKVVRDSSFTKSYTNLFPSISLSYSFLKKNSLNLSYRKRIDRPNYHDMNPFVYIFDSYTYEQGNTALQPQFADNFDFSYIYKSNYRLTLFYSHTKDVIAKSFKMSETNNRVYVMPMNLATYNSYGVKASVGNLSPLTCLQSSLNIGLTRNEYAWNMPLNASKSGKTTLMMHLSNRIMFAKGWAAEITGYYNGKMALGQMNIASFGQLSAGIQKKLWNDKATISIFSNDIFHTNRVNMNTMIEQSVVRTYEKEDRCLLGISFSWKFKKGYESKEFKKKGEAFDSKRINL